MQNIDNGQESYGYLCGSGVCIPNQGPKYVNPCTISDKEISNCTITNGSVTANGSSNGIYITKEVRVSTTQDISKETQHSMYMNFNGILFSLMLLFVMSLEVIVKDTKIKSLKHTLRQIQIAVAFPMVAILIYFILTLLMSVNWDKFF
jgi:hypothetical protein